MINCTYRNLYPFCHYYDNGKCWREHSCLFHGRFIKENPDLSKDKNLTPIYNEQ